MSVTGSYEIYVHFHLFASAGAAIAIGSNPAIAMTTAPAAMVRLAGWRFIGAPM